MKRSTFFKILGLGAVVASLRGNKAKAVDLRELKGGGGYTPHKQPEEGLLVASQGMAYVYTNGKWVKIEKR